MVVEVVTVFVVVERVQVVVEVDVVVAKVFVLSVIVRFMLQMYAFAVTYTEGVGRVVVVLNNFAQSYSRY